MTRRLQERLRDVRDVEILLVYDHDSMTEKEEWEIVDDEISSSRAALTRLHYVMNESRVVGGGEAELAECRAAVAHNLPRDEVERYVDLDD
jgi:hypothetical protein